jgi:hypothetical protein
MPTGDDHCPRPKLAGVCVKYHGPVLGRRAFPRDRRRGRPQMNRHVELIERLLAQ